MYKETVQQMARTAELYGMQEAASTLRQAFAESGYKEAMRKLAEEMEHLHAAKQVFMPINLAIFYAATGDKDCAFYCSNRLTSIGARPSVSR
jgi:hypothetical protein